jgi:hypothetical protein
MKNILKGRLRADDLEIIMECNYELTDNDVWIIRELIRKKRLSLFTSVTFLINKKAHIDFYEFDKGRIHICSNK